MRVSAPVILLLAVLVLLSLAGLFLPVRVRVRANGGPGDLSLKVSVKPPLLPLYIPLPGLSGTIGKRLRRSAGDAVREDAASQDERPDETRDDKPDESDGGITGALGRARRTLAAARSRYPDIKEALTLIIKAVTFEKITIIARTGTGDAYETAMLCGAVNAFAGIGLSIARRSGAHFREKPQIRVDPVFDDACFYLYADIETSFTLARTSYVAGKAMRLLRTRGPARGRLTLSSRKSVEY